MAQPAVAAKAPGPHAAVGGNRDGVVVAHRHLAATRAERNTVGKQEKWHTGEGQLFTPPVLVHVWLSGCVAQNGSACTAHTPVCGSKLCQAFRKATHVPGQAVLKAGSEVDGLRRWRSPAHCKACPALVPPTCVTVFSARAAMMRGCGCGSNTIFTLLSAAGGRRRGGASRADALPGSVQNAGCGITGQG